MCTFGVLGLSWAVPPEGDGGSGGGGVLGKAQNNHTNAGNKNMAQNKEEQKENSKGFVHSGRSRLNFGGGQRA